jgi:ubiquinone/menaquinone biosynthesis C-methylase UbiE
MSNKPTPSEIQAIQSAYRRRIIDGWSVPPGSRILEVGCGQGDMTVALAEAVGPTGYVVATDIASRDYGLPFNLGQATDLIKDSELGDRIEFHFDCDVTSPNFEATDFDFVVMVHCSWYFNNGDQLEQTLSALTKKAKTLCFAEWDTVPQSPDQLPHFLAVQIQGSIEASKSESISNIRTPFTVNQLKKIITDSGWTITHSSSPDTTGLQDADWEIAECLTNSLNHAMALNLSSKHLTHLEGQLDTLRQLAKPSGNTPLNSVAFVAMVK